MHRNRLSSKPVIGLLAVSGAALVAAFMFAPAALAGNRPDLPNTVRHALAEFAQSSRPQLPPQLQDLVDYWFEWHAIKVAITSLMLLTFGLLTAALWRRYRPAHPWPAVTAISASVLTGLATGLLILNIQATAVPLIALLPFTSGDASDRQLISAASPARAVLVTEVERYYWILTGVAGAALVTALLITALLWPRRPTDDARVATARRATSIVAGMTAGSLLLVVTFSTYSAIEPTDALHGLLGFS